MPCTGRGQDRPRIHGSGPPLVVNTCWLSHLQHDWQSPVWRHFVEDLGQIATVIRCDERGYGLSDWDVDDLSLEARVRDLEAGVDAAGLERFALLGMSQGGPVAIMYTVQNPDRVTRLALSATHATAVRTPEDGELFETLVQLTGWGSARPDSRFRRVLTAGLIPTASKEQMCWSTTCSAHPRRRRRRSERRRPGARWTSPTWLSTWPCRPPSCMPGAIENFANAGRLEQITAAMDFAVAIALGDVDDDARCGPRKDGLRHPRASRGRGPLTRHHSCRLTRVSAQGGAARVGAGHRRGTGATVQPPTSSTTHGDGGSASAACSGLCGALVAAVMAQARIWLAATGTKRRSDRSTGLVTRWTAAVSCVSVSASEIAVVHPASRRSRCSRLTSATRTPSDRPRRHARTGRRSG